MYIRHLDANDADLFRTARLAALREDPAAFAVSLDEEIRLPESAFAERLSRSDGYVLGAFADDARTLAGAVALHRESGTGMAHKAHLWSMFVLPPFRGRGLARALLMQALAGATALGDVRQVNLSVTTGQAAALALYRSVGFREYGLERRAIRHGDTWSDTWHMVRFLDRPVEGMAPVADGRTRTAISVSDPYMPLRQTAG